jgi:hypothetical protein
VLVQPLRSVDGVLKHHIIIHDAMHHERRFFSKPEKKRRAPAQSGDAGEWPSVLGPYDLTRIP